jgi:hypothetical protein
MLAVLDDLEGILLFAGWKDLFPLQLHYNNHPISRCANGERGLLYPLISVSCSNSHFALLLFFLLSLAGHEPHSEQQQRRWLILATLHPIASRQAEASSWLAFAR